MRVTKAFMNAALKSLARLHRMLSILYERLTRRQSETFPKSASISSSDESVTFADFCEDVVTQLQPVALKELSTGLTDQFKAALRSNPACMLPSYNHVLPRGQEAGTFLALDVGGSTFRVALIELLGFGSEPTRFISMKAFKIDNAIKELRGVEFFDWMALRIEETLRGQKGGHVLEHEQVLSMGLAWSFPIEQTSARSGTLLGMGKGFRSAEGLLGQDLGDILQQACERRNLRVSLQAIVNDSTATLLSTAYIHPSTQFSLILGTGTNIAAYLPIGLIGASKFGVRPKEWLDQASHVVVNTEVSMFGKGLLPFTRWDVELNAKHVLPDFQPLEHFVSGRYLGEIMRLILIEGITTAGLLGGVMPGRLQEPYSFETELLAGIQFSKSPIEARRLFTSQYPSSHTPSETDMSILRLIAQSISRRASAIVAAAIHALWEVRREIEQERLAQNIADGKSERVTDSKDDLASSMKMAYNGSVIESYPGFRENCQEYLDLLVAGALHAQATPGTIGPIELVGAKESSLLGAAIAVAVSQ